MIGMLAVMEGGKAAGPGAIREGIISPDIIVRLKMCYVSGETVYHNAL